MRPGISPAVYAATSESIALKESRRLMGHFGIRKPGKAPRVLVEIHVELENVADLSRMQALFPWPQLDELLSENWESINAAGRETLAQAIGRALFSLGFSALIVPSAQDRRGRNLVWFPENCQLTDQIEITGEQELLRWIAK